MHESFNDHTYIEFQEVGPAVFRSKYPESFVLSDVGMKLQSISALEFVAKVGGFVSAIRSPP